jgi:hypothetical protein
MVMRRFIFSVARRLLIVGSHTKMSSVPGGW